MLNKLAWFSITTSRLHSIIPLFIVNYTSKLAVMPVLLIESTETAKGWVK